MWHAVEMSVSFRYLTWRDDVLWTVPRSFKEDSTTASGSILRGSLMGAGVRPEVLHTSVFLLSNIHFHRLLRDSLTIRPSPQVLVKFLCTLHTELKALRRC